MDAEETPQEDTQPRESVAPGSERPSVQRDSVAAESDRASVHRESIAPATERTSVHRDNMSAGGERASAIRESVGPVDSAKSDEIKAMDSKRIAEPRSSIAESKISEKSSAIGNAKRSMVPEKSIGKVGKECGTSRDAVSVQESKKSINSIGVRPSKDIPKDLFGRRKSSRSIGKAVGSIISFRRGSIAEYFDRQKTAKYMNTYKLDSEKPFNVDKVEKILKEVLTEALDNLTYDLEKVPKQAKWASSVIRTKVKEQEFDRYKLICNVTIGEKRSQDMYAAYRFLWDADRDKHASYVHENMYVFAIAVCFGLLQGKTPNLMRSMHKLENSQ